MYAFIASPSYSQVQPIVPSKPYYPDKYMTYANQ
jgi:hypothetical protein